MANQMNFALLHYDLFYEPKKPNFAYVTKPRPKDHPETTAKLVKKTSRKYAIDRTSKPGDYSADVNIEDRIKRIEQTIGELTARKTIEDVVEETVEERMAKVNEKLDRLLAKSIPRTCSIKSSDVSITEPHLKDKHSPEAPKIPAFGWEQEEDKGLIDGEGDAVDAMSTSEEQLVARNKVEIEAIDESYKNLVLGWQLNDSKNFEAWRAGRAREKEWRRPVSVAESEKEENDVDTVWSRPEEWPEPMLHNLSKKEQKRLKKLASQHEPRSVMGVGTAKAQLVMMSREMRLMM